MAISNTPFAGWEAVGPGRASQIALNGKPVEHGEVHLRAENAELRAEAKRRENETDSLRLALANTAGGNSVLTEQVRETERENAELRRQIEEPRKGRCYDCGGSGCQVCDGTGDAGKQALNLKNRVHELEMQLEAAKGEAHRTCASGSARWGGDMRLVFLQWSGSEGRWYWRWYAPYPPSYIPGTRECRRNHCSRLPHHRVVTIEAAREDYGIDVQSSDRWMR